MTSAAATVSPRSRISRGAAICCSQPRSPPPSPRSCLRSARLRATRPSTSTGRSSSATARSSGTTSGTRATYPLASYSLLYYLPAALVGNLPLVFAAAVASTVLFSSLALREWGRPRCGRRASSACSPRRRCSRASTRTRSASPRCSARSSCSRCGGAGSRVLAALTVGFSPLAFVFLCLVVAAYAVAHAGGRAAPRLVRRRPRRRGGDRAARARRSSRPTPASTPSTGSTSSACWSSRRSACSSRGSARRRAARRVLRLWGLGSVLVYVVPSPLGDNWTRLERLRLPGHAPDGEPRRLPSAPARLARARRGARLQHRPVHRCSSPRGSATTRSRRATGSRRSTSCGARRSRATASRSCRRPSTGRRTGSRRPASRSRAAGTGSSTRSTTPSSTRSISSPPTYRRVAPLERRCATSSSADGAARLGRRPAGGADRCGRRARGCASSSGARTGRSTSCRTRLRS